MILSPAGLEKTAVDKLGVVRKAGWRRPEQKEEAPIGDDSIQEKKPSKICFFNKSQQDLESYCIKDEGKGNDE